MKYPPRISARGKYLREEDERIKLAPSLAEAFPHLKSLGAMLSYFGPLSQSPLSEVKCTFNLAHSKALFRFACPNNECVEGNFDLSAALARAVIERAGAASGELQCQGWRNKATIDRVCCGHILRYKLTLVF